MKTMFIGGRLHQQFLKVPKGESEYRVTMRLNRSNIVELVYRKTGHSQIFQLVEYNGKPVILSLDFFQGEPFKQWLTLLLKYMNSKPSPSHETPAPGS